METITYEKNKYVSIDDILKNAPIFCKGIRTGRDFLKKKEIKNKYFVYARLKGNEWEINEGKSVKYDRVFVKKSCLDKMNDLQKEIKGESVTDSEGIEKAPDIIELNDNEKFKDENGNVLEIETRGEREHDKIFFKVKDVAKGFDMNNLQIVLLAKNTLYKEEKDYNFFTCENQKKVLKKTSKKELFLTYQGMLHVLFASHSGKASQFTKWATETLFTVQMGTNEQKTKLSSKTLGTNIETVNEVFNTNANTLPVIYLFTLGYVKDLRKSMNISKEYKDDMIVSIYGCTKDFQRRTNEHDKFYKKITGTELKLKCHTYIDPQYIFKAESDISEFMDDMNCKFAYEKEKEMVILDEKKLKKVHKRYEELSKLYMGHIKELMMEKEKLETKVREQEDKMKIQKLEFELKIQQLEKDLEIERLKLKLNNGSDSSVGESKNEKQNKINKKTILKKKV